ncbi:hypothetical protein [Micromonospora deserti]|uniref:Uncharacterized protein n=1 Tax=Micromonospora deserti TaxID=2070366 RepID=A0A2W2DGD2_9ACTN|nr:hypothetical protein [Micromonospora deserti]PZG02999.1 hypothetical protein C1I99_00030 [Micromonospora deserti]
MVRDQYEDERKRELGADLKLPLPSPESLPPDEVPSECRQIPGDNVARYLGENWIAGLSFDEDGAMHSW